MGKFKTPEDYVEFLRKLGNSGLSGSPPPNRAKENLENIESVEERVQKILKTINRRDDKVGNMLFFVMYDIESDKVRRYVVKYLQRKGCTRVQRSIFLADLDHIVYNQIRSDLASVQAAYENKDSIMIVPISTDLLKAMKIIGQNINIDIITHSKNTLIF